MDSEELERELEESRRRRRAAEEQTMLDADEYMQQFLTPEPPPAPVARPAQQQEGGINWGRAVGEVLGKVGGAVVGRLTEGKPPAPAVKPPLPRVEFTRPSPPSEPGRLPELCPTQASNQFADVHEFDGRQGGGVGKTPVFRPAPAQSGPYVPSSETEDERRRRMALRPAGATPPPLPAAASPAVDAARLLRPSPVNEPFPSHVRPEDFRPSRNLPAPGEEAANDARFRERLGEVGAYDDRRPAEVIRQGMERARIAQSREYLQRRIAEIESNPTRQNGNSRLVGALKSAGHGALQGFARTGTLAGAAGGAAAGGTVGAFAPATDERLAEQRDVERMRAGLEQMYAREAARLKLGEQQADTRLRNAQADYYSQRPDLERDKLTATQLDRQQKAIQREIGQRLRDPRPFDDNDAYDSDLAERAERVGVNLNRAGFGDAQKPATIEVLDPTDPQHIRKIRMQFDRNTRQWSPVQANGETVITNRVQPVGDDGRTPTQRDADDDRDRAFSATQDYRTQQLGLSTERLREQMLNGLSSRASREFTTATRGLFERRGQIEREIQSLSKQAAAYTIDPAEARRRIESLEAERNGLTSQIDAQRGKALGAMSAAPSGARTTPTAPAGRAPVGRVSRKNFDRVRAQNPSLQGKSDAEVEAALKAQGVEAY